MSVEEVELTHIEERCVLHVQLLMKAWLKLYNPQASYFTVFFSIINIQIVRVRCLIKHTGFLAYRAYTWKS